MQITKFSTRLCIASSTIVLFLLAASCSESKKDTSDEKVDVVAANIKSYSHVWDEIMNKGNLAMFNDSNFTKDVVMHVAPSDITGIDTAKAYYAQFLTGFSSIQFTIKDIFGQGDKLVKQWNFKGTHTGEFFGISASGKSVSLDGVTLVRMSNGKIAEERDFLDNMDFMTQLGVLPSPKN